MKAKILLLALVLGLTNTAHSAPATSFLARLIEAAKRHLPTDFYSESRWSVTVLPAAPVEYNGDGLNVQMYSEVETPGIVVDEVSGQEKQTTMQGITRIKLADTADTHVAAVEINCSVTVWAENGYQLSARITALRERVIQLIRDRVPGAQIEVKYGNSDHARLSGLMGLKVHFPGGVDAATLANLAREIQRLVLESLGLIPSRPDL
jgi:hypothetical protein